MFLIDTNVFSELIRPRPNLPVVRRLLSTDPEVLFACEMTRYELRFGAALHSKSSEIWEKVEREILPLPIWLPIEERVALATADLQASLRRMETQSIYRMRFSRRQLWCMTLCS
jgi:predicted nucleic acid-binding protein